MPLYEVIVVTRIASAYNMRAMARALTERVKDQGGRIRNITNLGERVLNKEGKLDDNTTTAVGRYLSFEIDASPELKEKTLENIRGFVDVIRANEFKMSDYSYLKMVQRRLLHQTSPFTLEEQKDQEVIQDLYNYIEDYQQMKKEFKNPKEHYLKHKGKLMGEFWESPKIDDEQRSLSRDGTDKMEFYKREE
ncbi:unnamed protein product [Moneuplotes crassus]|uniref:Ribosomal protein S6 n=1 Tax=Euplotes crassus TaxID=5936 RepID=A0AAD1Y017_EUPCR|nr:unnamed protein product [Moneuplotes crassus]